MLVKQSPQQSPAEEPTSLSRLVWRRYRRKNFGADPRNGILVLLFAMACFLAPPLSAQVNVNPRNKPPGLNLPLADWKAPTMGGQQYWSDVRWTGGWKIQRHADSGSYRLLDSREVRHARGTLVYCQQQLDKTIAEGRIPTTTGPVVIVLHGLMRSNDSMQELAEHLEKTGGYTVINLAYASTRKTIGEHAADLASVVEQLDPQITEINFVAHSMGNIVVRHYLKDLQREEKKIDPRFHRMVMLAPPNQGSSVAKSLGVSPLFRMVAGKGGVQLGLGWNKLKANLATPPFEFGIIAGAKDESKNSRDSLLDFTPQDFTVFFTETKLDGATDSYQGPFFHWDIKDDPDALAKTLHFLQHGSFVTASGK